jgi:hypothetical protein
MVPQAGFHTADRGRLAAIALALLCMGALTGMFLLAGGERGGLGPAPAAATGVMTPPLHACKQGPGGTITFVGTTDLGLVSIDLALPGRAVCAGIDDFQAVPAQFVPDSAVLIWEDARLNGGVQLAGCVWGFGGTPPPATPCESLTCPSSVPCLGNAFAVPLPQGGVTFVVLTDIATPTPSPTPSPSPSPTPTAAPSPTPMPSPTPTPTPPSPSPTPTPSPTPAPTLAPTATPTPVRLVRCSLGSDSLCPQTPLPDPSPDPSPGPAGTGRADDSID